MFYIMQNDFLPKLELHRAYHTFVNIAKHFRYVYRAICITCFYCIHGYQLPLYCIHISKIFKSVAIDSIQSQASAFHNGHYNAD